VDPEYPDLLAATPGGKRDDIRHAIGNLHEMEHLAGNVLEAKSLEALEFLDSRKTHEEAETAWQLNESPLVAASLDDAVRQYTRTSEAWHLFRRQSDGTWTYWGWRLFDNESDARGAFG
jgi:hypothetical protein